MAEVLGTKKRCPCCPAAVAFADSNALNAHIELCRKERPFSCGQCGLGFQKNGKLTRHKRTHNPGPRSFSCSVCEKKFPSRDGLVTHGRRVHQKSNFTCAECGRSFGTKTSLAGHCMKHLGLKPRKCSECPKTFRYPGGRCRHQQTHRNTKPFTCADCGKSYTRKDNLMAHVLEHLRIGFRCNLCGKISTREGRLREHKRVVHGANGSRTDLPDGSSSVCPHCPKSRSRFADSDSLKAHIAICRIERPIACSGCQLRFRHQWTAIEHRRYVHDGIRFVCDDCGWVFQKKSKLQKHLFKPTIWNCCPKVAELSSKAASKLMEKQ